MNNHSKQTTTTQIDDNTLDFTETEFSTIHGMHFYPDFNILDEKWQSKKPLNNNMNLKSTNNNKVSQFFCNIHKVICV